MENSQDGNEKYVLVYISTNNITELNKLISAKAELVYEKIGVAIKSMKEKSNDLWENQTGKANKKSTKISQYDKRRKTKEHLGIKRKTQHKKK